jgi:hypothetical protein
LKIDRVSCLLPDGTNNWIPMIQFMSSISLCRRISFLSSDFVLGFFCSSHVVRANCQVVLLFYLGAGLWRGVPFRLSHPLVVRSETWPVSLAVGWGCAGVICCHRRRRLRHSDVFAIQATISFFVSSPWYKIVRRLTGANTGSMSGRQRISPP